MCVCVYLFFQIRSDKENSTEIWYYLMGPGVDQPPKNVFQIDRYTGFVKVLKKTLDREEVPFYHVRTLHPFCKI